MGAAAAGPLFDRRQIALLRDALDEDDLQAMFAELPATVERAAAAIRHAVEAGDLEQARRAAHVLKGVASSFGAAGIAALALEFEQESSLDSIAVGLPAMAEVIGRTTLAIEGGAGGLAGATP